MVRDGQRPAVSPGRLGRAARSPSDEKLAVFGEQLEDAKTPPAIPTWEQIAADAVNTELEKATIGDASAEDAAKAMQEKAELDRDRVSVDGDHASTTRLVPAAHRLVAASAARI